MRMSSFLLPLGAILCSALPAFAEPAEQTILNRAMAELEVLQELSLAAGREYCSILALDEDGRLIASKPRRGWRSSCRPRDPRGAVEIIASLHTHGTHHPDYDSEMPSTNDMLGDMEEGILGFVATPGGRVWMLDGITGTGRQVCGRACVISDPDYDPADHDPIPKRVTLDTLYAREEF